MIKTFFYYLQYTLFCRWMLDPRSSKRDEIVSKIKKTDIKPSDELKETVVDPNIEPFSELEGKKICNFCAKKYLLIGPLMKHLKTNHGIDNETTKIVCNKCSKEFNTLKQLTIHKNIKTDCSK